MSKSLTHDLSEQEPITLSNADHYVKGMEVLLQTVQELSLARDLQSVQLIVRTAARRLTGCDGASFVLRDGVHCFYADEDAIAPLWKGKRFPMESCISGWVMLHRRPAIIPDIYTDARIPHEAYRPTFVKSLVMVPIRRMSPIGAIGNYWATPRQPGNEEVRLLQALANATSVALENVQIYSNLQKRTDEQKAVIDRLQETNRMLEKVECERQQEEEHRRELQQELLHVSRLSTMGEFASALSHELNQPLCAASTFLHVARIKANDVPNDSDTPTLGDIIARASSQLQRAHQIIENVRSFIKRGETTQNAEDINKVVEEAWELIVAGMPGHGAQIQFDFATELPPVMINKVQVQQVLVNLLRNALEAMRDGRQRRLTVRTTRLSDHEIAVAVQDTGPGLASEVRTKLFSPFVSTKKTGMGLGLSLCQSIIQAHCGRIWADAALDGGTVFSFTIPIAVNARS
jgi:signal transduction histidine kinase